MAVSIHFRAAPAVVVDADETYDGVGGFALIAQNRVCARIGIAGREDPANPEAYRKPDNNKKLTPTMFD